MEWIDRFLNIILFWQGTMFCFSIAEVRLLRNSVQLIAGHLMEISVSKGNQVREQSFGLWDREEEIVAEVSWGDCNLVVKQFELLVWKREPEKSHLSAEPTWLCLPVHKDKWLQQFAKLMLTLLMLLYWDLADVLYCWNTSKRLIQCFIIAVKTAP